ncbi:MAG TPA: lipase family protein [Solirubrobacterales bacterium]|nr:lipase family protein [Solirubrobacterales bacterium]
MSVVVESGGSTRIAAGRHRGAVFLFALALLALWAALAAPLARAVPTPEEDPFYDYAGGTPLAQIAPGTVLKTRTLAYHVAGIPLPVKAVQLLYRSTGQTGQPTVNVTSVLKPPLSLGAPKIVAYQSFYDSLNPDDEPSYAISGGLTLGGAIPQVESALFAPELLSGKAIVIADTEGEAADFAAGPEYGLNTLDSLRAALASPATGLSGSTKIGLIGYSGGAIATEWAAELAPSYAPDINSRLVGATFGGVLADPAHNLHYIDGSAVWAGVMPMAIVGISRAFGIDLTSYMSDYGKQVFEQLQKASIAEVLGRYPGLTWEQLAKPQYATPESVPAYVEVANQLIMGTGGTPTIPLQIAQGNRGELEGTAGDKPGIGPGDGVMIAGDVRTLAREYCARGVAVQYAEYPLDHIGTAVPWIAGAMPWLDARFAGTFAPQNCGQIAPGNPLTPIGQ